MKKLLLLLLCVPLIGLGQGCDYGGDLEDSKELCNLMNQQFSFSTEKDANTALENILSVTGLAKNFVLMPCEIDNASAVMYKGVRYILYNKDFMKLIVENTDAWSNISILAHEIGHHLNAHTLGTEETPTLSQRRQWELEADKFSGDIMYKLGYTLEQAQEAIRLICTNDDDTYSTHPKLDKRLAAIEKGYNNARNIDSGNNDDITTSVTAMKYVNKGWEMEAARKFRMAIEYFSRAIEIDPNCYECYTARLNLVYWYSEEIQNTFEMCVSDATWIINYEMENDMDISGYSYNLRAMSYAQIAYFAKEEDETKRLYQLALLDCKKWHELSDEDDRRPYESIANIYEILGEHRTAIKYYTLAIGLSENPEKCTYALRRSYYSRAMIKKELGESFCDDLKKSYNLKNYHDSESERNGEDSLSKKSLKYYNNYCK